MKKVFLNKITKILENQKNDILEKTQRALNVEIDVQGDETDEIQGKILALADAQLIARDKVNLLKIEGAFKRISEGTYGDCEECGEEISEKRLLINPVFNVCIGCAEHLEMIKKRK